MKAAHLAGDVVAVCIEASERIMTVGAEQNTRGDSQQFEIDSLQHMLQDLEEELMDQINYAAMAVLKIRERQKTL